MAKRTECIYVDTSAFIAFLDRSDTHHALYSRLFANPPHLVTTALVVAEGHGWFLRRYDVFRAIQFLGFLETLSPLEIRSIGTEELNGANKVIRKFSDQILTMTDAAGLALMRSEKIKSCWSTDRHLTLLGANLVME